MGKFGGNRPTDLGDYAPKQRRKKSEQQNITACPYYCKGGHNKQTLLTKQKTHVKINKLRTYKYHTNLLHISL